MRHLATGQLPLSGAILCCTSIAPEQRAQLATIGSQMGATIKLDLTSDVTHLVVGSIDSAKYRYVAKCREDVKVLSPTWLQALRDIWMEGDDDMDVASLEEEHRLPTFFGLKICLTGFDNPEQRRYIQETADANGAEYHGDLTKAVTHLIAAAPSGKKYEHALNWRMKIVSLEWFDQSRERGMVLDEALYNPTMPAQERGQGAWDRREFPSPAPGKRSREAEPSQALNPFRRKLRRSASTKMGTQSEALWAGITAASLERQQDENDDWTEDSIPKQHAPHDHTSTTHPEDRLPSGPDHAHDPRQPPVLPHHSTISDVPHDTKVDLTTIPERAGSLLTIVTNWWVERCLYGKRLVDPADDILSRPFDNHSITGFSGLIINSTAFVGIELLHVTKVVASMGATYDEQLSAKTSVLVCKNREPNEQKLKFATDRHIPAVHATWLWECLRTGQIQPYGKYQLQASAPLQVQNPRTRHQPEASADIPTARLSTEESLELQHKKAQIPKNTPMQRGPGPQPTRALDLVLSADITPLSTTNSLTHPKISTYDSHLDHRTSLPLRDIGANSPHKSSTTTPDSKSPSRQRSSSAESLIRPAPRQWQSRPSKTTTPDSVVPAAAELPGPPQNPPEEKDYSDILAQLRANRKPPPSIVDQNPRRGRRQLGRGMSTRSNDSTADSSGQINLDGADDREQVQEYQPSQELGWDSPGAAKAREQMIKRLGGRVTEKSVRVEGIGVVRDDGSEAAGARIPRKKREKGF
ncbi:hypothetical protein GQ44DRAFT_739308 [Phaeosphaeriaceae sp. PMI808]|nr:hypothetical protein GQ44DRAFT_739308 [Phaeosphaeriaceae sp. PMI808]